MLPTGQEEMQETLEPPVLGSDAVDDPGNLPPPAPPMVADEGYYRLLLAEAERLDAFDGLTKSERTILGKDKNKAQNIRRLWALVRLHGSEMGPPFVRVRDQEEYTWIELGRILRTKRPDVYSVLQTTLKLFADPIARALTAARTLSRRGGVNLDGKGVPRWEDQDELWLEEIAAGKSGARRP